MFSFLHRTKLKKDDLKGTAKLMYQDVSEDPWDQENLTKRNLDFSIESIRYIDIYTNRLMNTEFGIELLNKHFDNFVTRIGAYIGEAIKNNSRQDFQWYESDSVYEYSPKNKEVLNIKTQSVLYSKTNDRVIVPLDEVLHFLKGTSSYSNFLTYVEEMIRNHS
jgi:hypothetical protein